jgi:hypothetical protein
MDRLVRAATCLLVLSGAAAARADSFGGFSSVDRPYLVNQDKVCSPLSITDGTATGVPRCDKVAADRLAQLSFKEGAVQRGAKATFAVTASGRSLVVSRVGGGDVVRWEALDPISRVVEVYADHEDRLAVVLQVRRAGRDMTDVVGFALRAGSSSSGAQVAGAAGKDPAASVGPAGKDPAASVDPALDPALERVVAAARKQKGANAVKGWLIVLTLSPDHAEALFRSAGAALAAKRREQALSWLAKLGASTQPDAIEWMVAARFDPAFASLRADPGFRRSVGLDRKPDHPYDKVMGLGGVWEESGTSCDSPTVAMTFTRERRFRIKVRSVCEGMVNESKFAGTWKVDGKGVALALPNRDLDADVLHCAFEASGDE